MRINDVRMGSNSFQPTFTSSLGWMEGSIGRISQL